MSLFPKPGDIQHYQGKPYVTNEVGGIDIATTEPTEVCPDCGEITYAEFCDNGFGPYSVQVGPYHCEKCGWTEGRQPEETAVTKKCERCGSQPTQPSKLGPMSTLDYCAKCSKDLCPACMAQGCCGSVPAESGLQADFGDGVDIEGEGSEG